jgi:hypothetical protein
MMSFIAKVIVAYNGFSDFATEHPTKTMLSGFCTVLLSAGVTTLDFASQFPGVMLAIIGSAGSICMILVSVVYNNQMKVNKGVLKSLENLQREIKEDREHAMEEREKDRERSRLENEKLDTKIQILKEEVLKAEVIHEKTRNVEETNLRKDVLKLTEVIKSVQNLTNQIEKLQLQK